MRPAPAWALRRHWGLDPSITFLNHGSFGACPLAVLEEQSRLRAEMEAEPVRFLVRELEGRLDEARGHLGAFVGAQPADLAFVPNATAAVNAVLRWLPLKPGDELLTTDHAYPACRNALEAVAAAAGAKVVVARVPFPLASPAQVVAPVLAACSPRTRLALIDHVTSPTGLVLPVSDLLAGLRERGVLVLIDGAHAPGMIPLDIDALGADFYTGNCHKWICAPKGAAFLHVACGRQDLVRPLAISHGATSPRRDRSRFLVEADWTGTSDPTAWLSIPKALEHVGSLLPGGWPEIMARNRALTLKGRVLLQDVLQAECPAPDDMIAGLASLPLPPSDVPLHPPLFLDSLQEALWERRIEVPVFPWPEWPGRVLRIAPQVYTDFVEIEALGEALGEILERVN